MSANAMGEPPVFAPKRVLILTKLTRLDYERVPYELWEYIFKISEAEILSEIINEQRTKLEYSFNSKEIETYKKNLIEAEAINKRRFLTILN